MSTEAVILNLSDSPLWAPYKSLFNIVNSAVVHKDVDATPDLEISLKNHKPDFISLLKNPCCSPIHREAVKKSSSSGIAIAGQSGLQILSQSLVDEALIISDMFKLNELSALELLIAGQQQQPHFPGLTRGLVAMLLYYDGRRSLVSSLRTIVQAREGRTWTLGLNSELTSIVMNFTDQLKEEGLIMKVIDLVESIDISKELELLHKNKALGGPRYRKQVTDLITEIKQSLAEIVLCWACQSSLSHKEAMRLMNHLAKQSGICNDGSMDEATLTLAMALLYVIDVGHLQSCDEMDAAARKLNLICEPDLAASIHKELVILESNWQMVGMKAIFQFAWGISLRTMSQFPLASIGINMSESVEDDERTIDVAIEGGAFQAIRNLVLQSQFFHQEEFFLKRIHNLITDFIVLMPLKVKELRNRGDETARIIAAHAQEGLEPPTNLPLHFEYFMNLISDLYAKNPLDLDLALDYWCPAENLIEQPFSQRPSQRQVALYKFVRLAGDLLPPPLFVPYHQMLTSLSSSKMCAHHCFSLLKMNGRNVVGGQCSIVSWDHFFSTLHRYYSNLREELAMTSDARYMYRQRMLTKGITPQEVQGLGAVLHLISQVVKQNEVARVTLSENPQYVPIVVLLGLITCSVPPALKSSLIHCLAAFAASSEITFNIWHGLEAAQVIPTIKTTSVYHPSGILMELEEVETRTEEYPVTRAILTLINSLLDHPLPMTLGAGQRQPGIQPYIDFVRDKVLLRCNARVYKSHEEKWKIIVLCLKIMEKVLRSYRIKSDTFANRSLDGSVTSNYSSSHPGYSILSEMLQDSGLLRMVLFILDEGTKIMDLYSSSSGQADLEKSTLLALTLLHETLLKQDSFIQLVRDSGCDLLVTPLDNLLLNINPRSGQADHLCVISKYVMYNTVIPQHSLLSLRILHLLCASSHIAQHLVGVFDIDPKESDVLLNGFVECLEVDITGEVDDEQPGDIEESMVHARNKARQQLLMLLLNCLKFPGPNISHYLLGFNLRRPVNQTEIQEPGVMGSRRTCLHAILSLLDTGSNSNVGPINVFNSPHAAELAYQLVYALCANKDTSGPTLRYLRSTHDFLFRHLQFLPFKVKGGNDTRVLSQQSWLLKTLAIELRVTSAHHQRSHVQRLLNTLLDDKPTLDGGSGDGSIEPVPGITNITSYSFIKPDAGPLRRKLMRILDSMEFKQSIPVIPQWEYFDATELQRIFKDCEVLESNALLIIDVEELHRRLSEETTALQSISGLGQRSMMLQQEITCVLQYAVSFNASRAAVFAKRQSFDAWRQVTEVLLLACPLDMLGSDKKHQMVLEISQELIRRVMCDDIVPELMPPASGVILTLMATLHHSVISAMSCHLPHFLPSLSQSVSSVRPYSSPSVSAVPLTHHSSLLVVLKAIVECLLKTGSGLQRVRANFYSAFLNLLCIVQKPYDMQANQRLDMESAVLDQESENRKLRMEYMDTILSFGETIMEIVCRDACTGHDVTKMLALAVLDVAVSLDTQQQWLAFLVSKGYLRHILDSLTKDDNELQMLLSRNSNSYRIFYVFESKMALLTRIGSSVAGALALLRNGAIGKLAECRVLDLRPDMYMSEEMRNESGSWILPDLMKCYRQILMSVMKLILSITMTLGSQHREVTLQLLGFLSYNSEFFLNVLRDRSILDSLAGLEELSLVTAVLARAALDDPDDIASDTILLENRGQLLLLRHHLLTLLPCLVAPESVTLWGRPVPLHTDADVAAQMKIARLQVAANVLGLCCSAVTRSGFDVGSCRVLFIPSLGDATSSDAYHLSAQDAQIRRPTSIGRAPDLSLLVTLLYQCSSQLQNSVDNHKLLQQRSQSLSTLTSDELAEYLPAEVKAELPSAQLQRELARESLFQLLLYKEKEVAILSYMIESSAFILLRHLEYFLLSCKKNDLAFTPQQRPEYSMRRLQDDIRSNTISSPREEVNRLREPALNTQEMENFKAEIQSAIGEPFFRKLHSIEQYLSKGRSHVSFLQAIVHRIKRIVRLQAR